MSNGCDMCASTPDTDRLIFCEDCKGLHCIENIVERRNSRKARCHVIRTEHEIEYEVSDRQTDTHTPCLLLLTRQQTCDGVQVQLRNQAYLCDYTDYEQNYDTWEWRSQHPCSILSTGYLRNDTDEVQIIMKLAPMWVPRSSLVSKSPRLLEQFDAAWQARGGMPIDASTGRVVVTALSKEVTMLLLLARRSRHSDSPLRALPWDVLMHILQKC